MAVALVALLILRPWAGSDDDAPGSEPESSVAEVAPGLAAWLSDEVPVDTPIAASDDLRPALEGAGLGDRLGQDTTDDTLQVLAGEPAAPALVLARFESGNGSALSVVDPSPGEPTSAELEKRRRLAGAVLANPVAGVTGHAADVLRAGTIDARLLGLLAGLVARMDVHVADLPPSPGEPSDGPPARRLLVDEAGGERLAPGAEAAEQLVTFLQAQRPPFAPDRIEQTAEGVLVGFDYVSAPDAVVTAATS